MCVFDAALEKYKVNEVSLSPVWAFIFHLERRGSSDRGSRVHVLKRLLVKMPRLCFIFSKRQTKTVSMVTAIWGIVSMATAVYT